MESRVLALVSSSCGREGMESRVALVSSSGREGMERVVVARSLTVDVDAVWCVPSSSESNRSSKTSNSVREEEGLADGGASSISRSSASEEGEGLLGVGVRGVGGSGKGVGKVGG